MIKRFVCLCALLLTTACSAPHVQPYNVATQSPHLTQDAREFIAVDNVALPVRYWLPKKQPNAVIVALHGFNDYSNAFTMTAPAFTRKGIALYAIDQRGFGRAPDAGIWAGEDNLMRDANDFIRTVKQKYPHTPLYVMGASMGGAVVISALAQPNAPTVDGVILLAPAVWDVNSLLRLPLWMLVHTWPARQFTGEGLHVHASDNIALLRALAADPLVIKKTRADAIFGLLHLMDDAYSGIGKVKAPVFLLYGAHDQVIPPDAVKDCALRIKKTDKVAYYAQGYHMLLRDLHGDIPTQDVLFWMMHKDKPLPSGEDSHAQQWLR